MTAPQSPKRTILLRKWQQHLLRFIALLSVAGAISLIWTLAEPKDLQIWPTGTEATAASKGATSSGIAAMPASKQMNQSSTEATAGKMPKASTQEEIPVYLVGAVKSPGVYIVKKGIYLYELVELAGGLTAEAAASSINLAMRISDNQMVRIPTQAESDGSDDPGVSVSGLTASSDAININTATQAMLEELPGVGPATASAIIADRNKNGPFRRPEDLMRIPGIKESRYVLLEALITVN